MCVNNLAMLASLRRIQGNYEELKARVDWVIEVTEFFTYRGIHHPKAATPGVMFVSMEAYQDLFTFAKGLP
jgi:hypothetical protein